MGLFKRKGSKSWDILKNQGFKDKARNRDVHTTQDMERGERGQIGKPIKERILTVFLTIVFTGLGFALGFVLLIGYGFFKHVQLSSGTDAGVSFTDFDVGSLHILKDFKIYVWTAFVALISCLIINQKLMSAWHSGNSMFDSRDINTYENDQHIMLIEEMQREFDWFPDVGAHSSVEVSSLLSHLMIDRKGLKSLHVADRYKKDILNDDGTISIHKGEIMYNSDGEIIRSRLPIIDEDFGQELFTASNIPIDEKKIRRPVDVRKIEYNQKDKSGSRKFRDKQSYDTVSELINDDWEFPDYETQRPAGAYLVDTAPVNTMVLAITRAGKGQTVIEPTIDMWTREKRQNNIVVNDPKGELLVKFYVPATIRGYEIVQFNLINPLNTDIYNPLGFAAESARDGDFTKAASYIENIGDIFFPKEGADDPMWRARCCFQKIT